jgi:segregation and condensation protein B
MSSPDGVDAPMAEVVTAAEVPSSGEDAAAASADSAAPAETSPVVDDSPVIPAPADAGAMDGPPAAADLPPAELRQAVEALLFIATKPVAVERLAACLPGVAEAYLDGLLTGLAERYDREGRGWELRRIAHGWQLLTRRSCHAWVRQLDRKDLPQKLSKSALETLSIVAYRQPVTRGAIEDIRGVQCGPVLRQLMDLRLVQVAGRDTDTLGHPLLYGTTEQFLHRFGLPSLDALPRRHEFGA